MLKTTILRIRLLLWRAFQIENVVCIENVVYRVAALQRALQRHIIENLAEPRGTEQRLGVGQAR